MGFDPQRSSPGWRLTERVKRRGEKPVRLRCRCGSLLDRLLADPQYREGAQRVAIYSATANDGWQVFSMKPGSGGRHFAGRWKCRKCPANQVVHLDRLLPVLISAQGKGGTLQFGVDL